jgi:uncharacterized membrane protein YccC
VASQSLQRVFGCLLGGLVGLGLLSLSLTEFVPWILALSAAIWVCSYLQSSERGLSYIGTQAGLVLIMTLVQGWGPPDSIWPGIDRFVECAPGAGQQAGGELTGVAGLSEDESHDQTPFA